MNKLRNIQDSNLLKIKDICDCCVELEYIDGYILNTKKGAWIMGSHAYEEDYLDVCNDEQFIKLTKDILATLQNLHKNGICHTDMMDHNIMVDKQSGKPILIDLIGTMPYSEELAILDKKVFLEHVVLDGCKRLGILIPKSLLFLKEKMVHISFVSYLTVWMNYY